jgi:hypothetical protein
LNFELITRFNARVSLEIIQRWEKKLDFSVLSENRKITREIFQAFPGRDWDLRLLFKSTEDFRLAEELIPAVFEAQQIPDWFFLKGPGLPSRIQSIGFWLSCSGFRFETWIGKSVVESPQNYEFGLLSRNQFQKSQERIRIRRELDQFRFLILRSRITDQHWRREFELAIFPIRLRLEDCLLRKTLNHSPRLLLI